MQVSPSLSWSKDDGPGLFIFNVSLRSISNWKCLCEVREKVLISGISQLISITIAKEEACRNLYYN